MYEDKKYHRDPLLNNPDFSIETSENLRDVLAPILERRFSEIEDSMNGLLQVVRSLIETTIKYGNYEELIGLKNMLDSLPLKVSICLFGTRTSVEEAIEALQNTHENTFNLENRTDSLELTQEVLTAFGKEMREFVRINIDEPRKNYNAPLASIESFIHKQSSHQLHGKEKKTIEFKGKKITILSAILQPNHEFSLNDLSKAELTVWKEAIFTCIKSEALKPYFTETEQVIKA